MKPHARAIIGCFVLCCCTACCDRSHPTHSLFETDAGTGTDTDADTDSDTETSTDTDTETSTDIDTETSTDIDTETSTDADTDTDTDADTDSDADTETETSSSDPCADVICELPDPLCIDENHLMIYLSAECVDGECTYETNYGWPLCEHKCVTLPGPDECRDLDKCYDQFCTDKPDSECLDYYHLMVYDPIGSCVDNECVYPNNGAWPLCEEGCVELPGDDTCAEHIDTDTTT